MAATKTKKAKKAKKAKTTKTTKKTKKAKTTKKKARPRADIPADVGRRIKQEACFACANPRCRNPLVEVHHIVHVEDGGTNDPDNLIALCTNCHTRHHNGPITRDAIRAWKMILLSLGQVFDQRSADILLALDKLNRVQVSGDGVLMCAALIASGLVMRRLYKAPENTMNKSAVQITEKGRDFLKAWKKGDLKAANALWGIELED